MLAGILYFAIGPERHIQMFEFDYSLGFLNGSMEMIDTWSVAGTISEVRQVSASYVAYYLATDAHQIFIFFDTPNADARELCHLFSKHPRVITFLCDEGYWASYGGRPNSIVERQKLNARRAYNDCSANWLLHCDGDEYLLYPERAGALLAASDVYDYAIIPVAERVHVKGEDRSKIYSSHFRKHKQDNGLVQKLYGEHAKFLANNVAGHSIDKSFVRCHRDIVMQNHHPNEKGLGNYSGTTFDQVFIAHVDGFSEYSLILKFLRYLTGSKKSGFIFSVYDRFRKTGGDFRTRRENDETELKEVDPTNRKRRAAPFFSWFNLSWSSKYSARKLSVPDPLQAGETRKALKRAKVDRKLEERFKKRSKRGAQMRYALQICDHPELLPDFYAKLKTIDETQMRLLMDLDLLIEYDLDIEKKLNSFFPEESFSLAVDDFDAAFAQMSD